MPQHRPRGDSRRHNAGEIKPHHRDDLVAPRRLLLAGKQGAIDLRQQHRIVIGGAPEHDAGAMSEFSLRIGDIPQSAIGHKGGAAKVLLQAMDNVQAQRRKLAVFLRAQAVQPGVARVHDKHTATRVIKPRDEIAHQPVALAAIDADAVLDRDW